MATDDQDLPDLEAPLREKKTGAGPLMFYLIGAGIILLIALLAFAY